MPLSTNETDYLLSGIGDTIQATVLDRLVVAGVQGLLVGIKFATVRVAGASLLGIITVLFAMVSAFGAFIVPLPIAIYLAATHYWMQTAIPGLRDLVECALWNIRRQLCPNLSPSLDKIV